MEKPNMLQIDRSHYIASQKLSEEKLKNRRQEVYLPKSKFLLSF